jgi:hypothetical protein
VSLRDKINSNPKLGIGIGVGVLVVAIVIIVIYAKSGGNGTPQPAFDTTKGYFTDDDGKTTFVEDLSKLPPFDHNGKKAYRAKVFIDGHGQRFVAWLESYDDNAKKAIQKVIDDTHELPDRAMSEAAPNDRPLVKRPGQGTWVSPMRNEAEWKKITTPEPPDKDLNSIRIAVPSTAEIKQQLGGS